MPTRRTYILGKHSRIDANVTLGHTDGGWSKPLVIGDDAFAHAGSLVNKDVPPNTIAGDVPGRFRPMPEQFAGGTQPELVKVGSGVWDPNNGDDWTLDYPQLAARSRTLG